MVYWKIDLWMNLIMAWTQKNILGSQDIFKRRRGLWVHDSNWDQLSDENHCPFVPFVRKDCKIFSYSLLILQKCWHLPQFNLSQHLATGCVTKCRTMKLNSLEQEFMFLRWDFSTFTLPYARSVFEVSHHPFQHAPRYWPEALIDLVEHLPIGPDLLPVAYGTPAWSVSTFPRCVYGRIGLDVILKECFDRFRLLKTHRTHLNLNYSGLSL